MTIGEVVGAASGVGEATKSVFGQAAAKVQSVAADGAAHVLGFQKLDAATLVKEKKPLVNRAGESRSPYVRAHGNNPVAWQLWGDEAIELARQENKLLFVSIGYSACHWCHVMERESFENEEVAEILNSDFIPVKIDREERPDIDRIYMNFVQATNGSGGWPLNVFVTPNLEPVFGGTYWPGPHSSTPQLPLEEQVDFLGILGKLSTVWKEQEDRCRQDSAQILQQLKEFAAEGTFGSRLGAGPSSLDLDLLEEAYQHFATSFDARNGGFGDAPKFPTPAKLAFLLRLSNYQEAVIDVVGEKECVLAQQMALKTLKAISRGGIHDQIGHGFARYSVTADWSLPHFEKMLYDNAQLLHIYLDAFLVSSDPELLGVVYDIAAYLTEDAVAAPTGGFYSSEDADSFYRKGDTEKREGAFYVWRKRELESILGRPASSICSAFWGISSHGNVETENDAHDEFINQNVPKIVKTPKILASQFGMSEEDIVKVIKESRETLRKHRDVERVRPSLDDKIIVGWNGIAIGGLARTSNAIESFDPEKAKSYMAAAKKAAEFVKKEMYDASSNQLKRVWREGAGDTGAFADDYAFFIEGLIDLYEATFEEEYIKWAAELQDTQISLFYDRPTNASIDTPSSGGFFATPIDAQHTILRLKDGMDTSEPSTNGTSATNLYRLSSLLNSTEYAKLAEETCAAFESEMLQYPWLFASFMPSVVAGRLGVKGTIIIEPEVVVTGDATESVSATKKFSVRGGLSTTAKISSKTTWLKQRNTLLSDLSVSSSGKKRVMICENGICREEGMDMSSLGEMLPTNELEIKTALAAVPDLAAASVPEALPSTSADVSTVLAVEPFLEPTSQSEPAAPVVPEETKKVVSEQTVVPVTVAESATAEHTTQKVSKDSIPSL